MASKLREAGQSVNLLLKVKPGRKAFDYANRIGAQRVAYVAPDEWATGKVGLVHALPIEGLFAHYSF